MGIFECLMVVLAILATGVDRLQAMSDSPALNYWKNKLPNTPIPNTLRELIPNTLSELIPLSTEDVEEMKSIDAYKKIYYLGHARTLPDPSLLMFFLEKDLHAGIKMLLSLSNGSQVAYFLPRHLSDKIPFSSAKLSMALENLKIPEGSEAALTLKHTIEQCESPAVDGESKYCATSLESMVDYSTSRLGTNHVNVLVTNVTGNSGKQQYTITAVPFQSESGSMLIACHFRAYAYAVYFCHEFKNTTTAKVSLEREDGTNVEAVVVCHADTSSWDPNSVVLQMLNVKPGGPSVCHFLGKYQVVWLSAN